MNVLVSFFCRIMPHTYTKRQGKRQYQAYGPKDLEAALKAVKNGMSHTKASKASNVKRSTYKLQNYSSIKVHAGKVGRTCVFFPVEEETIVKTLAEVRK
ncbi:hypothetical protein HOLleu_32176 [Holothuria leucospilota]|uniref:Uncharacterized protein n=1 Tax=Holothuria leucospilota TaxID=206669 RepID=A0A9Q1BGS2_HOLLE|nr:hypothetical protein HOLleu_32176 [Holothuria leucospilota]